MHMSYGAPIPCGARRDLALESDDTNTERHIGYEDTKGYKRTQKDTKGQKDTKATKARLNRYLAECTLQREVSTSSTWDGGSVGYRASRPQPEFGRSRA